MTSPDILPNAQVRQHFLDRHQLRKPPLGTRLDQTLTRLKFVQVDSINTLVRAHDLILWSRQQSYRPPALRKMVDHSRQAFEAWTHDASILPMAAFPTGVTSSYETKSRSKSDGRPGTGETFWHRPKPS